MPSPSASKKKGKRSKKSRKSAKSASDTVPLSSSNSTSTTVRTAQAAGSSSDTVQVNSPEVAAQPGDASQRAPPSPVLSSLTESLGLLTLPTPTALHPAPAPASRSPSDSPAPPTPPDVPNRYTENSYDLSKDPTWHLLTKPSILHDSGTGPRVRDARAFLESSFAHPPWTEDPLCAEFAQPEMLQMLRTVLPLDPAMLLWYNKSRRTSRVCPVCQRLYNLGDTLSSPVSTSDGDGDAPSAPKQPLSTRLLREQTISGLCSPICFFMSSFHNPTAIRSAWGCMAEDLDDATWAALDAPAPSDDRGLNMLLKMTRLHDLGLAQLCVPDLSPDDAADVKREELNLGSQRTSVRTVNA